MLSANKVVHAEDTCTSVTGFICAKCQNYNICMNRFNTSFCTKDHKTHKAIYCYTLLLHQAARVKERRDILVSDRDQQRFFIIIIT